MYGGHIYSVSKSLTHVMNPVVTINRKSVYTQMCTLFSPHCAQAHCMIYQFEILLI